MRRIDKLSGSYARTQRRLKRIQCEGERGKAEYHGVHTSTTYLRGIEISFIIIYYFIFYRFQALRTSTFSSLVNYFVKLAISDLDRSLIEGPVVVVSSMGDC